MRRRGKSKGRGAGSRCRVLLVSALACAGPGLLALLLKTVALKERRGSAGTLLEVTGHVGEDKAW